MQSGRKKERGLFCCAVVLLAVIGQRADFLRSGDDMRQCVSDWNTVYPSLTAKMKFV